MQETIREAPDRNALDVRLDPVCGMEVAADSPRRLRVGDVEYRFCSAHCLERFARHPEAFLDQGAQG